jgi:hypothetical protein
VNQEIKDLVMRRQEQVTFFLSAHKLWH